MLSFFDTAVNTNGTITHRDLSLNPFIFDFGYFSDHIISGLVVTHPDAGDFLQCGVTAGLLQVGAQSYAFGAQVKSIPANPAADPRIDLVCADCGTLGFAIIAGTPAVNPLVPVLPASHYILGYLYHIAGSNSLGGVSFTIQTPMPIMPVGFLKSNGQYMETVNVTFNIPVPTAESNTIRADAANNWVEANKHKVTNEGFEFFGFVGNVAQPLGAGSRLAYFSDISSLAVGTVTGTVWNAPTGTNSLAVGLNVQLNTERSLVVGETIANNINTINSLLLGKNLNTGGNIKNTFVFGENHSINAGAVVSNSLIAGQTFNINAGGVIVNSLLTNSGTNNALLNTQNVIAALSNSSLSSINNSVIANGPLGLSGTIQRSVGFGESSALTLTKSLFNATGATIISTNSLILTNGLTSTVPLSPYDNLFIAKRGAFNLQIGASDIGYIGNVTLANAVVASAKSFFIGDDLQATGGGTSQFLGAFNCNNINYNQADSQYRNSIGLLGTDLPAGFLNTDFTTYTQRIKRNGFEISNTLTDIGTITPTSMPISTATPAITTSAANDFDTIYWTVAQPTDTATLDNTSPIGATFYLFSESGGNQVQVSGGATINGTAGFVGFAAFTFVKIKKVSASNWIMG